MNKSYVLFHLREAFEELSRTISDLQDDAEYGEGDFRVAMKHVYAHLNTAWNTQGLGEAQISQPSEADFTAWRQFPDDPSLTD